MIIYLYNNGISITLVGVFLSKYYEDGYLGMDYGVKF